MASFQNLMDVEEGQLCHLMAGQDGGSGERIRTGDDLSGEAATRLMVSFHSRRSTSGAPLDDGWGHRSEAVD